MDRLKSSRRNTTDSHTGSTRVAYLRDRKHEAIDIALDRAREREQFKAQHGKVRVLMVDGKPGPDAA